MNTTALLILYNPYYQNDVIESHLEILKLHGKVSFGKIKSKMRNPQLEIMQNSNANTESSHNDTTTHSKDSIKHTQHERINTIESTQTDSMQTLINQTSTQNPLQLFLTDYANLYVCKVVSISKDKNVPAPAYYDEKGLCVEFWFEISDMQELVRNNFANVRDMFLANFKTLHNNRTFALYGNDYTYPLAITMKKHRDYFATFHANKQPILHYHNMLKQKNKFKCVTI